MHYSLDYWRDQTLHLCADLPALLPHLAVVALQARAFAAALRLPAPDQDLLEAAALLHDIGKVPALRVTGFHPLDGATWLAAQGEERLANLVAHHGNAAFEARATGLTIPFTTEHDIVARLLDYADATTVQSGQIVTLDERLADIAVRYGDDNVQARAMREQWDSLAETRAIIQGILTDGLNPADSGA